jgi:glutamate transport system permease protein
MTTALTDELGPRARGRVRIASLASAVVLLALIAVALMRLNEAGQLEPELYTSLFNGQVFQLLLEAAFTTVRLALTAMVVALPFGLLLALCRISPNRLISIPVTAFIEFWRATPVLLLIFLAFFGLRDFGLDFSQFTFVVMALVLYNATVLAEIFRAGILSLDRGQSEAAYAVGLTYGQNMRFVVVPQAVRRMLPALIAQLVTLLKDTSLAYIIGLDPPELLRASLRIGEFLDNRLQALALVALIFIAINYSLSRVAVRLERRQARRYGPAAVEGTKVPEDVLIAGPTAAR